MDLSSTGPSCQISHAAIHISVVSSHLRTFEATKYNRFLLVCLFHSRRLLMCHKYYCWKCIAYFSKVLIFCQVFVKICNILSPEVFCHPMSIRNNCSLSLLHSFNLRFSIAALLLQILCRSHTISF